MTLNHVGFRASKCRVASRKPGSECRVSREKTKAVSFPRHSFLDTFLIATCPMALATLNHAAILRFDRKFVHEEDYNKNTHKRRGA